MSPLISIILPCYNSESYLKDCIDSVLSSNANFEVLLIDDGSTDNTRAIAEHYASKDSRIKVIHKQNGGYVSAVNCGLDNALGDYILFLGSDDALTNGILDALSEEIREGKPDVIAFRANRTDSIRDCSEAITRRIRVKDLNFAQVESLYPAETAILATRDTAKCYKRALDLKLRYTGKYGIDADGTYSILMCIHATSFSFLPIDGYRWTIREGSVSSHKIRSFEAQKDMLWNWHYFYQNFMTNYPKGLAWPKSVQNYMGTYASHVLLAAKTPGFTRTDIALFRQLMPILEKNGLRLNKRNRLALKFPYLYRVFRSLFKNG